MRISFTFVALQGSIKDEKVLKHLRRPDIEVILISEGASIPERADRPVIALVQCDQILENQLVRLPGKDIILAIPYWAQQADCVVGVSLPEKQRRKDPLGKSRDYGANFNTRKAIACMLHSWNFEKRKRAA